MANVNFFSPDGGTTRYPIEDTEARSRIAGQQSLLKDTVGWTGKNLLKNTTTTRTINGVTFTVNDDGSVTVNGTATANIIDYFINKFTNDYFPYDTSKEYILSGCPDGGSSNGYRLDIVGESGIVFGVDDIGNGAIFQFPKVPTGTERFSARIRIGNGTVCNNVVFKPMIRKADITDPTYEPYHESVEVMYEEEIHGVNLLTLEACFSDVSGVTRTINSDNSVTINGTATNVKNVYFSQRFAKGATKLDVGRYILSVGASIPSTCRLHVSYSAIDGSNVVAAWGDYGASTITFDAPIKDRPWNVLMEVGNGTNFNNLRLYPMLRKADIEDSTYRPYNYQAIQNQLNAQGVLGAKNLLKYPYVYTTRTVNGMTYTDLGNGAVRATSEGATTGNSDFHFAYFNESTLPKGKYYLSDGEASTNSVRIIVNKHNGSTYLSQLVAMDANHHDVEMDVDYDGYTDVRVLIWASTGATANNLTFYPMLRLASDPDDTYQPYVMTNRELTENTFLIQPSVPSTGDLDNVKTTGIYGIFDAPTHSPESANYCTLLVNRVADNNILQVVFRRNTIYTRAYINGTWYNWFKYAGTELT